MYFNIDVGIVCSCDDFFIGICVVVCGGIIIIIDYMGFGLNGCRLCYQLEVYRGYVVYKVVIDYSFYGVIQYINYVIFDEISMMVEEGLSSFKFYLIYQYKFNDDEVLQVLCCLYEFGVLIIVYLENDVVIVSKWVEFIVVGLIVSCYYVLSRFLECEVEVIVCMINLV